METPAVERVSKELFEALYGLTEPLLPLANVLYWIDVVRRLGVAGTSVDQATTCVFGGYFYNTSTRVPTVAEVEEHLAFGRAHGATQFLVPTVRNAADTEPLRSHQFRPLPWFVECIFELRQGLKADLNARLGRHRARSIERVAEKAEVQYPARSYQRADIEADSNILDIAAALHECNVHKYGHTRNFYSAPILRRLFASTLGQYLLIRIRRNVDTGEAVQASISLIDRNRGQLYWLVHGIARKGGGPAVNLFVAEAFELLAYAERDGIQEINLSRGGQQQKLCLGANRFNLLNNWVLTSSPVATTDLAIIAARCRNFFGLEGGRVPAIGPFPLQ
jgi:hypothetical protein